MRRLLAWTFALALAACGALAAHAAAYALTGASAEGVHGYLHHAPQLLAVLATLALGALAVAGRSVRPALWPFPLVAVVGFTLQEHVERLAHTGELPWLLTRPAFLIGLALQLPFALAAWVLARALLAAVAARARPLPPRLPLVLLAVVARPTAPTASRRPPSRRGRAPPVPA